MVEPVISGFRTKLILHFDLIKVLSKEKDQWEPWKNNPVIEYNSKDKVFRCKEHPDFTTTTSQGASPHSRSHGYRLDGTEVGQKEAVVSKSSKREPEIQSKPTEKSFSKMSLEEKKIALEKTLDELRRLREGKVNGSNEIEETTKRYIIEQLAGPATRLATDMNLLYLYDQTVHELHVFPYSWTFDQWCAFLITDSLDHNWHVTHGAEVDKGKLNNEQLEMVEKAQQDYIDYLEGLPEEEKEKLGEV